MFRRLLRIEKSTKLLNIQAPHRILPTRNLRVEIKTDIVSTTEKGLDELISAFNAAEIKTLKKQWALSHPPCNQIMLQAMGTAWEMP